MAIRCIAVDCEENAEFVKYQGKWYNLCHYHQSKASDAIRSQGGGNAANTSEYEECNYCRGAGRFNKKTRECDFPACKHYAWNCGGCSKKTTRTKQEPKILRLEGESPKNFCSEDCQLTYLAERKRKLGEEQRELEEQRERFSSPCDKCGGSLGDRFFYNQTGNDKKKFCSEGCYSDFYARTCDKCNKKGKKGDDFYYADTKNKTGKLCEGCYQAKKNSNNSPATTTPPDERITSPTPASSSDSSPLNSPSSSNSPVNSPNQNSSTDNNDNGSYDSSSSDNNSPVNSSSSNNFSYSPSQFEGTSLSNDEEFRKTLEQIKNSKGKMILINALNLTNQQTTFLTAYQDAKFGKYVDINSLDLPEHKKKELLALFELDSNARNFRYSEKIDDDRNLSSKSPLAKIMLVIGLPVLIIIVVVVAVKKRKKRKLVKK